MKPIELSNPIIRNILDSMSSSVYNESTIDLIVNDVKSRKSDLIPEHSGYSDEYFYKALNELDHREFGFPREALMVSESLNKALYSCLKKYKLKLQRRLCAANNSLSVVYPSEGYIGWHHNGNAPGYNILFSYSLDGKGWFKYYDYVDQEIKTLYDKPGWNVKVGYYPDQIKEPERVYWHAAKTVSPRLSIAFIVNDRDLWLGMINDITDGNYDSDVESQGPLQQ